MKLVFWGKYNFFFILNRFDFFRKVQKDFLILMHWFFREKYKTFFYINKLISEQVKEIFLENIRKIYFLDKK